jgi:hypothetical protein
MKMTSQNAKKASSRRPLPFGAKTDVVLRIAEVAALADQCDHEGNTGTAAALRRLARTLWGSLNLAPMATAEKTRRSGASVAGQMA